MLIRKRQIIGLKVTLPMQHSKTPTLSEAKGSAFRMSKGVKRPLVGKTLK